jgi:hypothetical protein
VRAEHAATVKLILQSRRATMATAIIQHRVKDYDAWRRVYDGVGDMQKAGGVVAESVYRREGDPNTVLVFHQFTSMSKAHDFVTSPQLRGCDAARRRGGRDPSDRAMAA